MAREGSAASSGAQPAEGERGLLVIGDDFDFDPRLAACTGDEIFAIAGATAGLGRDAASVGDMMAAHFAGADLERLDGAVHRRRRQGAGRAHALAQTDDARKRIDDAKALPPWSCDEQSAVVRAEIERGHNHSAVVDRACRPLAVGLVADVAVQSDLQICAAQSSRGGGSNPVSSAILSGFPQGSKPQMPAAIWPVIRQLAMSCWPISWLVDG